MCRCIAYIHSTCLHQRKFDIIDPCPHFKPDLNICHDTTTQTSYPTVVYTVMIYKPLLCVTCFREVEDEITERFDYAIREMTMTVKDVEEALKMSSKDLIVEERESLKYELICVQQELKETREERRVAVAAFRKGQGVWGDG
ncbi:MAG: hypothetical protein Q9164_004494 [Protoblastenia rupestris]